MRTHLSQLLTDAAKSDPKVIVLTGDHGYALFDQIRKECPSQFINCGVIEQAMIGIAAGLARAGLRPIVYGLASFVPMRCLEQIKLDICFSNLPVMILGDGAGLVYATLGASHHCSEDLACLRPMPNLTIYEPADRGNIQVLFYEALAKKGPSYLRIGRTDLGDVLHPFTCEDKRICFVASGSMSKKASELAHRYKVDSYHVTQIKPIAKEFIAQMMDFQTIVVFQEHSRIGGIYSSLVEEIGHRAGHRPRVIPLCLKTQFADKCGSWQYALSEHEMDDAILEQRVKEILNGT